MQFSRSVALVLVVISAAVFGIGWRVGAWSNENSGRECGIAIGMKRMADSPEYRRDYAVLREEFGDYQASLLRSRYLVSPRISLDLYEAVFDTCGEGSPPWPTATPASVPKSPLDRLSVCQNLRNSMQRSLLERTPSDDLSFRMSAFWEYAMFGCAGFQ